MADDAFREQLTGLGGFIRDQRHQAQLTLRELAERANVSNPYLSQIERGLHEPSVRVLSSIASALDLSATTLFSLLGFDSDEDRPETERAIRTDPLLTDEQRSSLLAVYRSYVGTRPTAPRAAVAADAADPPAGEDAAR